MADRPGEEETIHDNNVATVAAATQQAANDDMTWWIAAAETCVRITAAGFAGSLVGLAKERALQEQANTTATKMLGPNTIQRRAAGAAIRHHPTPSSRLPTTWSIGCMVFVGVLETSRRYSPASNIVEQAPKCLSMFSAINNNNNIQVKLKVPAVLSTMSAQQAAITIADYAIGGTVAGLAGALARRTALASLTMTGFGFGILAGMVQAASDAVGNYYGVGRNNSNISAENEEEDSSSTTTSESAPEEQ